jgi:hypothetical protein
VNQTRDSFKNLVPWLAALFLMALGAHLWMAWLYGSPLPQWDQWYEASFFKSWETGNWKWADFLAGNNEHRVFLTRVLDVGLIGLNGRWEPMLQMTVNAFILAAYACGLAVFLWDFLGRKNGWLVCFLLIPFFTLPFEGENATWGFNSQQYFVCIFGLPTIAGLGFGKPGSWRWCVGALAAIVGLFTMANGLLAPMAVAGLLILRAIKNRRMEKTALISLAVSLAVFALGAALSVTKDADHSFQAHSFGEFTAALTRDLSWPFYNAPMMPCLIILPLALLVVFYVRPNFQQTRAAEFLLALALWSVLQSVVLAYGRANYGGPIPSSRYMDWLDILVIASVFAAVLLAQLWERYMVRNSLLALAFIGIIFFGLYRISGVVVDGLLVPSRVMNLVAEERVQRFAMTGNESDFLERPTLRPDPQLALTVIRDKDLQPILPAICLPTTPAPTTGWPMALSQWLQEHSITILSAGLILFIGLCGYGLARGALGMSAKNPIEILAVLAGVAALCLVWSKHDLTRESLEYRLEEQIVFNFKVAGNLKRADIHEQKAEALKQFAN